MATLFALDWKPLQTSVRGPWWLVPAQTAAYWTALRKQADLSAPLCYEDVSVGDAPDGSIPDRARHGWSIKSRGTSVFPRPHPHNPANLRGHTAQAGTSALCSQLLTKDPESRLSSLSDIQSAPYLADMNWDAVFEKVLTPGFVPNVSWGPVRRHDETSLDCALLSEEWVQNAEEAGRGLGGLNSERCTCVATTVCEEGTRSRGFLEKPMWGNRLFLHQKERQSL